MSSQTPSLRAGQYVVRYRTFFRATSCTQVQISAVKLYTNSGGGLELSPLVFQAYILHCIGLKYKGGELQPYTEYTWSGSLCLCAIIVSTTGKIIEYITIPYIVHVLIFALITLPSKNAKFAPKISH